MALGGAAGEPVSRLALEEPSLFCIRRPVTKKKRAGWREKGRERARKGGKKNEEERDRGEERPKKKRRVPAPSASPVSFKSDKCAAGNMTEKNNAEGPGGGGGAGCRRDREGRGNGRVGEGGEEGGSRRLGLEKSKN